MSNAMAEKIDCNLFEKVSAKYIGCSDAVGSRTDGPVS